jgi:opacity protein-like surface antigen
MRSLYVAVGLALCSSPVLAADFGIGVSVRSDDGWVYVPIDISKNFRLEPSVRYSSRETSSPSVAPAYASLEVDSLELGIGVFGLQQVEEAAHLYYGGRVAYVDTSITQTFRDESSQDGYRIGPTVGFEYLFGGHFSVGGEASYMFVELDGDDNSEQSSSGTETRLIFRYMF